MFWTKDHKKEEVCSKCGKVILPKRWLGIENTLRYCYRCGTNIELSRLHRELARMKIPETKRGYYIG